MTINDDKCMMLILIVVVVYIKQRDKSINVTLEKNKENRYLQGDIHIFTIALFQENTNYPN